MTDRNPGGDATGLMQSLRKQDDPASLLLAENLGQMIRKFIHGVITAVADANEGKIERELGVASVQADSRYYARQMTGAVAGDYKPDGDWYPKGCAAFLRQHLRAKGDDEEVLAEGWASVAHHVFAIVQMPEDQQQRAVDDLVKATIRLFGGFQ